jgi:tetratricopeptide (TPR) repeat protein
VISQQSFEEAVQHHQSGRLAEAEAFCRQVLDVQNVDAGLLSQLGSQALEVGWNEAAAVLFGRAADIAPNLASVFYSLGRALTALGRPDEAIAACGRSIQLQPDLAEAHNQLGVALATTGRLDDAVAAFREAVRFRPGYAEAFNNLGIAFRTQGRLDDALAAYKRAVQLRPDCVDALNDMGNLLEKLGRSDEAVAAFRKAILLHPDDADLYNNLGIALVGKGLTEEALDAYKQAITLNPHHADAHHNLANALGQLGRLAEAQDACRRALEINPQDAQARHASGTLHLLAGELGRGWPLYEERWNIPEFTSPRRDFPQPMWDGSPLEGQRLLVHCEQGFGDSIQFIRYIPLVAGCGGSVIIECPRPLLEFFSSVRGGSKLVAAGDPLPPFETHIPMMSLPFVFGTTLETIPQNVPYIFTDAARRQFWREWLGDDRSRPKVGLAWAGRTDTIRRSRRAVRLHQLLPLFRVQDVDLVSLQMDDRAAEIWQLPGKQRILDPSEHIGDFADTAALVSQLDLVISIDTAVAHLAGALGKPAWVMLPFAPDWRWMLGRTDSPWYPTMRLFRQQRAGEWDAVVAEIRKELQRLAEEHG